MSVQYSGGFEVYEACDKMFNDLIKHNKEFKDYFKRNKRVVFERLVEDDGDVLEGSLVYDDSWENLELGYEEKFFDGVVDADYGDPVDDFTELHLTDVLLYEKEDAYLYVNGVDMFSDDYNKIIKVPDMVGGCAEYPSMDDVLVKKGRSYEWTFINGAPNSFLGALKKLFETVDKEGFYGSSLLKIHMVGGSLCVTAMNPYDGGVFMKYTDDVIVKGLVESIMSDLNTFSKPVKEVFYFAKGKGSMVRVRQCADGECVLVVS